jgi:broad specificity phosphatase PhoE
MKNLFFMKIGPYNSLQKGLSKFESLKLLTLQKIDPTININEIHKYLPNHLISDFDLIITSNLRRSKETAKYLTKTIFKKNIPVFSTDLLNEVKFDISKFCSKEEYEKQGSNLIRKKFIESFIKDNLIESRKDIKQRMDKFENLIANENKKILCISHTFFMKLYIIYKKERNLFQKPKILNKYLDPNKRIFEFCEVTKINP